MWNDPIVEEIRKFRDAHAARFNHDMDAIINDLQESEKSSNRPVVSFAPKIYPDPTGQEEKGHDHRFDHGAATPARPSHN